MRYHEVKSCKYSFALTNLTIESIGIRHLGYFRLTYFLTETYMLKSNKKHGLLSTYGSGNGHITKKYNNKTMNLEMIKITYKVLSVGGKVNGMAPPMWLLLRSLCNAKQKTSWSFYSSKNTTVTQLLVKSYVFPISQNKIDSSNHRWLWTNTSQRTYYIPSVFQLLMENRCNMVNQHTFKS